MDKYIMPNIEKPFEMSEKKLAFLKDRLGHIFSDKDLLELEKISEEMLRKLKKNVVKKEKLYSFLVTVNANSTAPFLTLKRLVEKVMTKKWVSEAVYNFEQRSEQVSEFSGFHSHMLLKLDRRKAKSDIIREVHSTCKSICTKNAVNVKYIKSISDFNRAEKYIQGIKSDGDKFAKMAVDVEFRKHYDLQAYYVYKK